MKIEKIHLTRPVIVSQSNLLQLAMESAAVRGFEI